MGDYIVGIDIGTSKVCAIIGKTDRNSQLNIIGKGMAPCNGLKKGVIVDIESTAESIRLAVAEAESVSGVKVSSAYVNIHGMHVSVVNNKAWIGISTGDREITKRDIDNVLRSVRDVDVPEDMQLIDVIVRQYIIDGYDEIMDPIGMAGTRLEVDADIVAGRITSVQNIVKSVERAGFQIDGIVVEAFATGGITLSQDERDMGVILIDVGGGVTDISAFKNNRLAFCNSLPVGGDHITNDVAIGLRMSNNEAEKIKQQFELAMTSLIKNDQEVTVFDINENAKKEVKVSEIVEIIEARVFEIFSLCRNQFEKGGFPVQPDGGIVLAGAGISYIDGCKQLAQEVFGVPVRLVQTGQFQSVSKPEFLTSVGIVRHVESMKRGKSIASEKILKKAENVQKKEPFVRKLVRFIRKLF